MRARRPEGERLWKDCWMLCAALIATLVFVGGCDTSVQAINPSDQYHYSVFGVVNPAQDTQWVRVESLPEPTSAGAPPELDVTVTLTHLGSGQTWSMKDSVMEVFRDELQHNFWTTAPISPGASYRVTVRNDEGDSTWATTTTPSMPPDITLLSSIRLPCINAPRGNTFKVRVDSAEELASLKVRYFQSFLGAPFEFLFDSYDDAENQGTFYTAEINYREDLERTNQTRNRKCIVDSARVLAAAGGPDWPEWARYNDATISQIARPDSFTNVKGGHGMFSGVYTAEERVTVEQRNP